MSAVLGYLGGFVVLVALAIAGMGLRDVRARRRAWEEYERRRDAMPPVRHPYPQDHKMRRAMVLRHIVEGRITPEEAREHQCDGTISVNDYRAAVAKREMLQKG